MVGSKPLDAWDSGEQYELYVGRWSRKVAEPFLAWLEVPAGSRWLDVGCGTGALVQSVLTCCNPLSVVGIDRSPDFISHNQGVIDDSRVRLEVADAVNLQFNEDEFDAAISGLVINFVSDPNAALSGMKRVTKSGGVVGVYVWDYAGRMEMMRHFWDAATEQDESILKLDEGKRFPLCNPEPLKELFDSTGLLSSEVWLIEIDTQFRDFDDYWTPFLGGQGPAPSYTMSLDEKNRQQLRDSVRKRLPIQEDGTIHLKATAWAAKGIAP
jgi:SAM-dependent methyltransferase